MQSVGGGFEIVQKRHGVSGNAYLLSEPSGLNLPAQIGDVALPENRTATPKPAASMGEMREPSACRSPEECSNNIAEAGELRHKPALVTIEEFAAGFFHERQVALRAADIAGQDIVAGRRSVEALARAEPSSRLVNQKQPFAMPRMNLGGLLIRTAAQHHRSLLPSVNL